MSSIPQSYHEQNGCHNCRHCFHWYEYDEPYVYYCTFGSERPKYVFSVAMRLNGEDSGNELSGEEKSKMRELWYKWAEQREVEPWGMCDEMIN